MSAIAVPTLAIQVLHASAYQLGIMTALGYLGPLVVGLPAGVWLDGLRRIPVLVMSDLVRFALMLSVALVGMLGHVAVWQLCVVVALVGTAGVFYDTANQAMLPTLLSHRQREAGNAVLAAVRGTSTIGGPTLGGILVAVLGTAAAINVDAASYLIAIAAAMAIARSVRRSSEPAEARTIGGGEGFVRRLASGVDFVRRNALLRRVIGYVALVNLGGGVVSSVFYLFLYRSLRLDVPAVGAALAVGNIGILVGAFVGRRLTVLSRPEMTWLLAVSGPVAFWLLAVSPHGAASIVLVAGYQFVFTVGGYVFYVYHVTLRQKVTPADHQARVYSVIATAGLGPLPLGALAGGVLGNVVGFRWAIVVGATLATLGGMCVIGLPALAAVPDHATGEQRQSNIS